VIYLSRIYNKALQMNKNVYRKLMKVI